MTSGTAEAVASAPRGLAGVVVTDTELSDVRGREGFYHYRQYSAVELARARSLEDVWFLLLSGHLPDGPESTAFTADVAAARTIPDELSTLLPGIAAATVAGGSLDGLRTALSLLGSLRALEPLWDTPPERRRHEAVASAAAVPTVLAALHRLSRGLEPVPPDPRLGHAADFLRMVTGASPDRADARMIEQYLVLTVDHGFNASTFTARVIASTGADFVACLVGAVGALSGPLHGGAPSRALDTLDAIGTPGAADAWIRGRLLAGERLMGFGHPVYRTEDPRSRLLRELATARGGPLVDLAVHVESRVLALLAELRPDRALHTNVEFYAGVVMDLCGLPRGLFTPTFAVARVLGWTANILEQATDRKIIRPAARYVGPPAPQPVPPPHS